MRPVRDGKMVSEKVLLLRGGRVVVGRSSSGQEGRAVRSSVPEQKRRQVVRGRGGAVVVRKVARRGQTTVPADAQVVAVHGYRPASHVRRVDAHGVLDRVLGFSHLVVEDLSTTKHE